MSDENINDIDSFKVLNERMRGFKYRLDCVEKEVDKTREDLIKEVDKNREERNKQIETLAIDNKKLKDDFMIEIQKLSDNFILFQKDILRAINGVLAKMLIAVFSVFGAALVGLIIFVATNWHKLFPGGTP